MLAGTFIVLGSSGWSLLELKAKRDATDARDSCKRRNSSYEASLCLVTFTPSLMEKFVFWEIFNVFFFCSNMSTGCLPCFYCPILLHFILNIWVYNSNHFLHLGFCRISRITGTHFGGVSIPSSCFVSCVFFFILVLLLSACESKLENGCYQIITAITGSGWVFSFFCWFFANIDGYPAAFHFHIYTLFNAHCPYTLCVLDGSSTTSKSFATWSWSSANKHSGL